ncbi:MAG: 50S ribosomal protein L30 [bacterium]|nr:50S ribosomal protein L30 [bacterium]
MAKKLEVTQIRGVAGRVPKHQATIKALGLSRPNKTVVHNDTPQIRGMLKSVGFMVQVREIED